VYGTAVRPLALLNTTEPVWLPSTVLSARTTTVQVLPSYLMAVTERRMSANASGTPGFDAYRCTKVIVVGVTVKTALPVVAVNDFVTVLPAADTDSSAASSDKKPGLAGRGLLQGSRRPPCFVHLLEELVQDSLGQPTARLFRNNDAHADGDYAVVTHAQERLWLDR
jgi:hypothetical protein